MNKVKSLKRNGVVVTNCPNCGAPLESGKIKCEYCGTSYYDLSTMPTDKPFMMSFIINGVVYTTKVMINNMSVTYPNEPIISHMYDDRGRILPGKYISRRTFDICFEEIREEI